MALPTSNGYMPARGARRNMGNGRFAGLVDSVVGPVRDAYGMVKSQIDNGNMTNKAAMSFAQKINAAGGGIGLPEHNKNIDALTKLFAAGNMQGARAYRDQAIQEARQWNANGRPTK